MLDEPVEAFDPDGWLEFVLGLARVRARVATLRAEALAEVREDVDDADPAGDDALLDALVGVCALEERVGALIAACLEGVPDAADEVAPDEVVPDEVVPAEAAAVSAVGRAWPRDLLR